IWIPYTPTAAPSRANNKPSRTPTYCSAYAVLERNQHARFHEGLCFRFSRIRVGAWSSTRIWDDHCGQNLRNKGEAAGPGDFQAEFSICGLAFMQFFAVDVLETQITDDTPSGWKVLRRFNVFSIVDCGRVLDFQ